MLDNRIALTAVIGQILGIIIGLYCKISIVPIYLIIYLGSLIIKKEERKEKFKLISFKRYFRYVKIIFNKKVIKIIVIISCITNSIVLYQNNKYENLYKNVRDIEITGIVESQKDNRYKIKVNKGKYKNTKLYVYNNSKLEYGDEIWLTGKFSQPKTRTNYKGFDYKEYLKTQKIYGSISAKSVKVIAKGKIGGIFKFSHELANQIKNKIEKSSMKEDEKKLLEGILLGEKDGMSEDIINNFSESNISHILAISGMHISYIILFSNLIFGNTIGNHYSKICTSIIIVIYMFMTSFPPSLVRAGITGIILLMSKFLHRRADTWESLGIAMFCILTYNPFLISNVGLLLSFAGTIGIIVFNNTLNKYVNYKMDKIYRKLVRKNKKYLNMIFIATKTKTFKVVKEAIILTISATLAVSPIVLVYFNKLSITSLLISVISSFLVGPIVVLGLIFIIVKINIIQILLEFLLRLLIILANCGSKLPLNQVYLITPNVLQILLYYCFIFSLFYILKINMERKKIAFQIRIKNLISLFKYKVKVKKRKVYISFVLICFIYFIVLIFPKNLRIYFVDVGQGDCSLIVTPLNKTILIDGGGSDKENYNVRRKCFNAISPR